MKRCIGTFAYYARWIEGFSTKLAPIAVDSSPLRDEAVKCFEMLRKNLLAACLRSISNEHPFTVECDASGRAIEATLNQNARQVAFMSPSIEKKVTAIIDAV